MKKVIAHKGEGLALCFNSLGDTLVSTGGDNKIKFWNTKRQEETQSISIRGKPASIVSVSNDGEFMFAGTIDNKGTLYRIRNGIKQCATFAAHKD